MTTPARTEPTRINPLAEMLDWLDTTTSPFHLKGLAGYLRVEDFVEDNKYVLRADLPGIDPDKDVSVTVDGDVLTIRGQRHEEDHDKHHAEVRYGSFARTVRLPASCRADDVSASYNAGVLEVVVPVAETTSPQEVPVVRTGS